MTDFAITETRSENSVDTRWRASRHGQFQAQPGTLDLSKFVEGTHYNIGSRKDNVIPSGIPVTKGASGMYEPWAPAATVDGYINDNQGVDVLRADGTKSTKAAFARLWHGLVDPSFIPVADVREGVVDADHSVQITYL